MKALSPPRTKIIWTPTERLSPPMTWRVLFRCQTTSEHPHPGQMKLVAIWLKDHGKDSAVRRACQVFSVLPFEGFGVPTAERCSEELIGERIKQIADSLVEETGVHVGIQNPDAVRNHLLPSESATPMVRMKRAKGLRALLWWTLCKFCLRR
jgi:hypothetical protein